MISDDKLCPPGEVLRENPGLKRHKLNYWGDKKYVRTKTIKQNGRNYRYFYINDIPLIKVAYKLIVIDGYKDRIAFEKIKKEGGQLYMFYE